MDRLVSSGETNFRSNGERRRAAFDSGGSSSARRPWLRSERPRVQVLLPETTVTLALQQSGSASLHNETLPNAIVSGLQQRTRVVEHAAGSSLIIVRFSEVGAPAILHDRVDLLYNRTLRAACWRRVQG